MIKKLIVLLAIALAVCFGVLAYVAGENGLTQVFYINELKTFTRVLVSLLVMVLMLRLLDKSMSFNFKDWIENANQKSIAHYLAARFLGVCILFGCIILAAL